MWRQEHHSTSDELLPQRLIGTREAFHFTNEVIPRTGVVVESNHARDYPIAMTVADFEHGQTVYVLPQCFTRRKHAATRSQVEKDCSYYNVLENVSFDIPVNGIVSKRISAAQKMFSVSLHQNVFTVECVCVIKKSGEIRCYAEVLGEIEVRDADLLERVTCDNVTFKCLVAFEFVGMQRVDLQKPSSHPIRYWLHKLIEVSPTSFDLAFNTPWMPSRTFCDSGSDDECIYSNEKPLHNIPKKQIYDSYFVTPTEFYVLEHPTWKVHLAYDGFNGDSSHGERRLRIGEKVVICAAYSAPLKKYIAYDITQPELCGRIHAHFFKRDGYDVFTGYVSSINKHPGYYMLDGSHGVVVDRRSILVGKQNVLHCVDMRYEGPEEGSYSPLIICDSNNKFNFEDDMCQNLFSQGIFAICIGPGRFFSKDLPYIDLVSQRNDEIIGYTYKINFVRVNSNNVIQVCIEEILNRNPVFVKAVTYRRETVYEFWVSVMKESIAGSIWMASCPEFGIVNIPDRFLTTVAYSFNAVIRFKPVKEDKFHLRPFISRIHKKTDAPATYKFAPYI